MAASVIYVGANGKPIDLLNPRPEDIDFVMVAEQLAKIARYVGGTPDVVYSVAQHTVIGARAILKEYGSTPAGGAAAYFALHDVPEHVLGDDPTPKKRALEAIAEAKFGALAGAVLGAFAELTDRFDVAVHVKAGLAWPPPASLAAIVEHYDRLMLITEWASFMRGPMPGARVHDPAPLPGKLEAWPWQRARDELLELFLTVLP